MIKNIFLEVAYSNFHAIQSGSVMGGHPLLQLTAVMNPWSSFHLVTYFIFSLKFLLKCHIVL